MISAHLPKAMVPLVSPANTGGTTPLNMVRTFLASLVGHEHGSIRRTKPMPYFT
jgi:hypothetical protein